VRLAVAAGAAAFALFFFCLPGDVGWWDTGEYQTTPYIAGILHPTGFPAYTMLGWLFTHAFALGNVAWRMNVFSALAAAIATGVLVRSALAFGCGPWPALGAAAVFATSTAIWSHAMRAGVETLVVCFGSLAIANALAWSRAAAPRTLVFAALFTGLALATHLVAIWFIPGIALLKLAGLLRRRPSGRTLLAATAVFVAALALYAYLPLRSAAISQAGGDPVLRALGIAGQPFWDSDHPATVAGFLRVVTGSDFGAGRSLGAVLDLPRYPAFFARFGAIVLDVVGVFGAICALAAFARSREEPWPLLGLLVLAFGVVPFSVAYGALVDAQKYTLVAAWCLALLAALGADAIARALARRSPALALIPILGLAIVATQNVDANHSFFASYGTSDGRAIISEVQRLVPDGAVIFAGWSYVTPLGYAAYVEHSLGTRLPVTNIPHDHIAAYARTHAVYYLPFPENELDVDGAQLELIPGSGPPLYRVVVP
jgi:hypothetical protein